MNKSLPSEVRQRLVGTRKLVSTEETLKDGGTRPFPQFGPNGKGLLMYQADGYMCAFLVNPDEPRRAHTNEQDAAGIFAYCGGYEIDVERKQIVHTPEIATDSNWVGLRQVRPYEFEGERLIFSDTEKGDSFVSSWQIVWKKVR